MREKLNKLTAALIVIMLVGMNLIPDAVYATNIVNELIENKQEESVEFDAEINGEHQIEAGISDELNLNLRISLRGDGYLKNPVISLDDSNFVVSKTADEINKMLMPDQDVTNVNRIIESIEENVISIREMDNYEELAITIPVKFNMQDEVSKEDIEKDYEVKLTGVYVNGTGRDEDIEKTVKQHLKWNIESEAVVSQELVRYIKYEDKTMISMEITSGIKENKIPVTNREIETTIPKINNEEPEHITVVGKDTEQEKEDGILKITQLTEPEKGNKYSWNSEEKYVVTYIYNTQVESEKLETETKLKITTISEEEKEAQTDNNEFDVEAEIGNMVQAEIVLPEEINKGYIYTNLNRPEEKLNTEYEVNYKLNIGYADLTDKITLGEGNVSLKNENGEEVKNGTDDVVTTKVKVEKEEIEEVLGEEGSIIIKDTEGETVGTINKDTTEVEMEKNIVFFEISKPAKEGDIELKLNKAIKGENSFTTDEMVAFKSMAVTATVKGYNGENEITTSETEGKTNFTEPTSKASINLNTDALSTVTGNKDVEFDVVLNRTEISDTLYTNPTIKITVPEEVKNITLKSAKIIYDEELLIDKVEQNGRDIIVNLIGTQTQYNTLSTTKGTLLRIVADMGLDILATSNETKVTMEYTNGFTGETNTAEKAISIVAPNQIVTTNQIDIDGQTAFALDKDVDILKVKTGQPVKTMQVTGKIINNMGSKAEGVQIIGRIPSTGNKTVGGVDLGSNIETNLSAPIEIVGFTGAQVYYSTNIDESIDGQGWQEQATSDSKSYKIVLSEGMDNKTAGGFRYSVSVPANLDYEQILKENYGLYYNNNAEEGVTQNLVESIVLGIETGKAPEIKVNITALDTNEGYAIKDGDTVKEGQYITYRVNVQNTGSQDANDVKVKVTLPEGLKKIGRDKSCIVDETWNSEFENEIGILKGGDTQSFNFDAQVNQVFIESSLDEKTDEEKQIQENKKKLELSIETSADILEENIISRFVIKNSKGSIAIGISTNAGKYVEPKQDITYRVRVDNVNFDEKNNVKVLLKLPNGIIFKTMDTENQFKYDKEKNEVTVNIDKMGSKVIKVFEFTCENTSENEEVLNVFSTVSCNELKGEMKSNYITHINNVAKKKIIATQSSNMVSDVVDSDTIEFYININNTSELEQSLIFSDELSSELEIKKYSIIVDGMTIVEDKTNYIMEHISIPANKTAKVFITAKILPIFVGTSLNVESRPIIEFENGDKIEIEPVVLSIDGTTEKEQTENGDISEESNITEYYKSYRIQGSVWYDENSDGIKDNTEQRLQGNIVKLIDAKTNKIAFDTKNNELITITNSNGEYLFENIVEGTYIVNIDYDEKNYDVTEYEADNVEESINSNFVRQNSSGEIVAATDIIKVKGDNIYNIDLGLVKVEQLNISVNQSISKISIIKGKQQSRNIDFKETMAKLELSNKELKDSTILVEYNIKATNYGDIAGYAKQIIEYIPEGMKFNSEMNPDWYMGKDGYLYTVNLSNEIINQGESKDIKLVLTKKMDKNEVGIIRGKTELKTSYSETGLAEIRAQSAKFVNSESDVSTSDLLITKEINIKAISIIGITIGIFALLVLVTYEVKKHIINKFYNIDSIED